jgi:prepilin-type processing-associated H-X9-DG protein
MDSTFPVLGNRGPKDGHDPRSITNGPDGRWRGGHFVYGDGHVESVLWIMPDEPAGSDSQAMRALTSESDNPFAIDDEENHSDAILSFTRKMKETGPVIQFD